MKNFRFVDLFCGGGGSITGAVNALREAGMSYEGRGFNHWDIAIKTIQLNHPEIVPDFERARSTIENVLPDEIFSSDPQRIDCVWASPSCTHHSNAAGGKPRSNQLRSQPEYLLPYLRLTKCRRMFVENVKELRNWGPLLDADVTFNGKKYKAGQADPRKAGAFFNLWYREIKASGYQVDMQIMNAADYGAATSRERLIIQAVRKSSGERIVWPEPTHMRDPGLLAGSYKPWRSAAEIIDWSIPGESIFDRKKPLCANTMRRIEAGIRKYWGAWAEPFLIVLRGTSENAINSTAIPLSAPLPTITAGGDHVVLIEPFLCRNNTETGNGAARIHGLSEPLPVIDTSNRYSLVRPLMIPYHFGNGAKDVAEPLQTLTTVGNHAVIQPVVIDQSHPGDMADAARCKSSEPFGTFTTRNNWATVMPLFIPQQSCGEVKPINNPLPTIATSGAIGVVTPFLTAYYGCGFNTLIHDPVPAICTKDRFGLIQGRILIMPDGKQYRLDITHRMLTAAELAAATGFPDGYRFAGGDTAAKKQIGNAVCPDLARALYLAALTA